MPPVTQPSASQYNLFGFDWPVICTGVGAPTATNMPDGSLYLRADPASSSSCLYVSVGGIWTALS